MNRPRRSKHRIGELAIAQYALPDALQEISVLGEFTARVSTKIGGRDQPDHDSKVLMHDSDGFGQVGIVRDDDGALHEASMGVVKEVGSEVNV